MNEMRKLMEAIEKIDENYYGGGHLSTDVRQATNRLHEMMDEGILDPRWVADAALTYMSESEVADMARVNELFPYDDDDMEESVETVGEAYDEEVSGEVKFRNAADMTKSMLRDLQKLERNTSRVYREAQQSERRKDFPQMLINELGETLHEITNLVEKYEDAYVSTPGKYGESVEILGEDRIGGNENREIAEQLYDLKEEIKDLIDNARNMLRGTVADDGANSYWIPHILMALDKEHDWLGGSMLTLQDSINELVEGDDEEDDGSAEYAARINEL